MEFTATYYAKPAAIHRGDYILHLRSTCGRYVHTIDAAEVPRGTALREVVEEWAAQQQHTFRIDWSSLTSDTP